MKPEDGAILTTNRTADADAATGVVGRAMQVNWIGLGGAAALVISGVQGLFSADLQQFMGRIAAETAKSLASSAGTRFVRNDRRKYSEEISDAGKSKSLQAPSWPVLKQGRPQAPEKSNQ